MVVCVLLLPYFYSLFLLFLFIRFLKFEVLINQRGFLIVCWVQLDLLGWTSERYYLIWQTELQKRHFFVVFIHCCVELSSILCLNGQLNQGVLERRITGKSPIYNFF